MEVFVVLAGIGDNSLLNERRARLSNTGIGAAFWSCNGTLEENINHTSPENDEEKKNEVSTRKFASKNKKKSLPYVIA